MLDEYITTHIPSIAEDFKRDDDTCISVTSFGDHILILTKKLRLIHHKGNEYFWRNRNTWQLLDIGQDLKAKQNEMTEGNVSVGFSQNGDALSCIIYRISGRSETNAERKLRMLSSDHRWFLKNLCEITDIILTESVTGKRGQGVASNVPFSDITITRSTAVATSYNNEDEKSPKKQKN